MQDGCNGRYGPCFLLPVCVLNRGRSVAVWSTTFRPAFFTSSEIDKSYLQVDKTKQYRYDYK
jgi:hypothetical protein